MKWILAGSLVLASILDSWTTTRGVNAHFTEINPLANAFIQHNALWLFIVLKMTAIVVVLFITWRLKDRMLILVVLNVLAWAIVANNVWVIHGNL